MSVEIQVQHLPEIDILAMADSGLILRAECETPPNGVPVFITRLGWNELLAHHLLNETIDNNAQSHHKLLMILSRITAKILGEAARYCQNNPATSPHSFTIETDLFPSNKETSLIFVREKKHSVACALLGTQEHLRHILSHNP